jgi:GT2 family glycosyltransferase
MNDSRETVSVIVPVRDKKRFLAPCIDSILVAMRRHGNAELVIVDNMSTDGAWELLNASYGTQARLVRSGSPTVAGVRNLGARDAAGGTYCFVDSDCVVPEDYLTNVVATMRAQSANAVGHGVRVPEANWLERAWQDMHHLERTGPARWLPGACFSVDTAAFRQVGGFAEGLVSGEDIDLAERLRSAGFLVWSEPSLIIIHLDNPATLGAFLRKEIWRGTSAIQMGGPVLRNKVLVMATLYVVSLIVAVAILLAADLSLLERLMTAGALVSAIPFVTAVFRLVRVRQRGGELRLRALVPGTILYAVYYVGRAIAAARALLRERPR